MSRRVLYICHNHVSVAPGGVEVYAQELYKAMRDSGEFEPILLARTGAPYSEPRPLHPGTRISAVEGDPHQYLFFTDLADFDAVMMTNRHKQLCTRCFRNFLETYKPDLIHFHHSLFFGFETILETRQTLPRAPIVYTLHDYVPICHRDGQMVTTRTDEPCLDSSPKHCHMCFPDISPQTFFMRRRLISSHLARVDQFLAPSQFLLERFVDWGIPRQKIRLEEYGRLAPTRPVDARSGRSDRNRIGFFGRLSHFKGVTLLLEAMKLLHDSSAHLFIYGDGLDLTSPEFRERFRQLLDATRNNVTFLGRYPQQQLPQLMAHVDWVVVPSIWWENSPLVIQEAFTFGRPVICSGIGGMAEKVAHGINGLHFRVNDPSSLADAIRRATTTQGLWDRLRDGIPKVHDMHAHILALQDLYQELLTRRASS